MPEPGRWKSHAQGLVRPVCVVLLPPGVQCGLQLVDALERAVVAEELMLQGLVQPLDLLGVGERGRIVYIVPREPGRLVRLSNLGIVPGATIDLQQRRPATVLRIGETTLAMDPAIAGEIYVRKVG